MIESYSRRPEILLIAKLAKKIIAMHKHEISWQPNHATSFACKTRADCKTNMQFQIPFMQSAMVQIKVAGGLTPTSAPSYGF